jgi:hypothetical protein
MITITNDFYNKHFKNAKYVNINSHTAGGLSTVKSTNENITMIHNDGQTTDFKFVINKVDLPCDVLFGLAELRALIRMGYVFKP